MKKQYYYCVYANEEQVQIKAEDQELRNFLNQRQVKRVIAFLNQISKSYLEHCSEKTAIFYSFKYNEFTNLSKLEAGRRMTIHGVKGSHNLKRSTPYISFFISDEADLYGSSFFDCVFGTEYPSEQELRLGKPEQIAELLEHAAGSPEKKRLHLDIREKDRMTVCRIVERLWSAQIMDSTCRLVILLPKEHIYERSMELLQQIYLLLPQRLRMNMGFAVDSNFKDIKMLTERGSLNQYCDLPVHIFTMRKDSMEELERIRMQEDIKYPILYFDPENPETEECNEARLQLLLKLSEKISDTTDAKMSYAEKLVLEDGRRWVSFKNLEEILSKMDDEAIFWWNRKDLESPKALMNAYYEQNELMQNDDLRKEALLTFYTQMLPWKNYALALNDMILDEAFPDRDEILRFFRNELYYAAFLDASGELKTVLEARSEAHEKEALEKREIEYRQETEQLCIRHRQEMDDRQSELDREREKGQELEQRLEEERTAAQQALETQESIHQDALRRQNANHQEELAELRTLCQEKLTEQKNNYQKELDEQEETFHRISQDNQKQYEAALSEMRLQNENLNREIEDAEVRHLQALAELRREKKDAEEQFEKEKKTLKGKIEDLLQKNNGSAKPVISGPKEKNPDEASRLKIESMKNKISDLEKQKQRTKESEEKFRKISFAALGTCGFLLVLCIGLGIYGNSKNKMITQKNSEILELRESLDEKEQSITEKEETIREKNDIITKLQMMEKDMAELKTSMEKKSETPDDTQSQEMPLAEETVDE